MTTDRLTILEQLVEELVKDNPTEERVQQCMLAAGLEDSKDPIDRINQVLRALHFEEKGKDFSE